MAGGAGQSQTPMGGGSSPLNTGGGMSGGFGGGQQTSSPTNFGPMVNYGQGNGGGFGGGQQNNASLLMYPQNPTPYTGNPNQTFNNLMGGLGGWSGGQQQPSMPSFATPGQQSQSPTASPQVESPISHFGDMQYRPQQQPSNMRTMGQIFGFGGGQQQQYGGFPGFFGGGQQPGLVTDAEDRAQMSRHQTGRQQPMQNPFQPQQSLSFDQWKQQPRIQDQAARTPEQQLQRDQQDYQQYLSGTRGMQSPPPMQNAFQPQQPSFMQDPEYQGYQTQANDLQRQMNEYMQKAPMYQQMQDLQNKMAPFQQRYYQQQQDMQRMQQPLNQQRYDPIQAERAYYERMASQRQQPMQQRQFQQPSPFRRGQFQQPAGLQGLMGMLGGRGGMQQPRMSMDMPQTYGHMEALPQNFMKNGGKV